MKTTKHILKLSLAFILAYFAAEGDTTDDVLAQSASLQIAPIADQNIAEGEFLEIPVNITSSPGAKLTYTVTGLPAGAAFFSVPAFPGAEGYGARAKGGRGGRVIHVTNLNHSGPGSLQEALAVKEPRIIVFDVSGEISGEPANYQDYPKHHRFYVADAPVTIAGQTAPGAGITLKGELYLQRTDGGYPVNDAIVRFLRVRGARPSNAHAFSAFGDSIIFDHLSGAWGNDEDFGMTYVKNGTLQWSLAEPSQGAKDTKWEPYPDSDEDGLNDRWEEQIVDYRADDAINDYVYHVKPYEDPDGDGYSNLQEQGMGTNPLLANSSNAPDPSWVVNYDGDNDGLADWWEDVLIDEVQTSAYASQALKASIKTRTNVKPTDDLDNDGITNKEEYEGGMYPVPVYTLHNFGMIIGYDSKDFTIHHNLFAHHLRRAPLSGTEVLDQRNNVMYDVAYALIGHPLDLNYQRRGEHFKVNFIGNYLKPGPSDMKEEPADHFNPTGPMPSFLCEHWDRMNIVDQQSNYFDMATEPKGYLDIWNPVRNGISNCSAGDKSTRTTPYPAPSVTTHSAQTAYQLVLAHAGCLPRDILSERTVEETATRTGKWGKFQQPGGMMAGLTPGVAPPDRDRDGMPDAWEQARGRNPDVADNNIVVGSGESFLEGFAQETRDRYLGYTYIEYYLNELADKLIIQALREAGFSAQEALLNLPGYGKIPQPTFSWTPGYSDSGTHNVTLTVSDGSQSVSRTFTISVRNYNRAPFINERMFDQSGAQLPLMGPTVQAGDTLKFSVHMTDQDGTYSASAATLLPGASFYPANEQLAWDGQLYDRYYLEWSPTLDQVGKHTITLTASDGDRSYQRMVTVNVALPAKLYTITAVAGTGGTINPSGKVSAADGKAKTFNISADADYAIDQILVDGAPVGITTAYTFKAVTANHTIEVRFRNSPGAVPGLVLYLPLNGSFQDASPYGNNGIASGNSAPAFTADRFGNPASACIFDGTDDYISIPDNVSFNPTDFTMAAWINGAGDFSLFGSSAQYLASKGLKAFTNIIGLYIENNSLKAPGTGYPSSTTGILAGLENQWIHVAVAKSGLSVDFYLNGLKKGTVQAGYNLVTTNNLKIGAKCTEGDLASNFFKGKIDEFRFYNRALAEADIERLYNSAEDVGHVLSISALHGQVTRQPNKTWYNDGETVTLTAVPLSGYRFAGWTEDLSGTKNPITVIMNANKRVTALFSPLTDKVPPAPPTRLRVQ